MFTETANYTNVMRSAHEHSKSSLSLNRSFILLLSSEIFNALLWLIKPKILCMAPHSTLISPFIIISKSSLTSLSHPQLHLWNSGDVPAIPSFLLSSCQTPKSFKPHIKFHLLLGHSALTRLSHVIISHLVGISPCAEYGNLVSTIIPCEGPI